VAAGTADAEGASDWVSSQTGTAASARATAISAKRIQGVPRIETLVPTSGDGFETLTQSAHRSTQRQNREHHSREIGARFLKCKSIALETFPLDRKQALIVALRV
jgi:hypothetical protein